MYTSQVQLQILTYRIHHSHVHLAELPGAHVIPTRHGADLVQDHGQVTVGVGI
jgi:hypothetical protein